MAGNHEQAPGAGDSFLADMEVAFDINATKEQRDLAAQRLAGSVNEQPSTDQTDTKPTTAEASDEQMGSGPKKLDGDVLKYLDALNDHYARLTDDEKKRIDNEFDGDTTPDMK